ncbi:MAG: DNA mismatch repair protein MutS, partial [Desulfobacterota bacterium]|nr:DNA mismatch repair protein MutS [Thermodesulfobacteriota bacterium]
MTPMLKQYLKIKKQYPDAILFFRLGDFYEMFFEDAKKASQILEITLTSRESGKGNRIPMCGIPFHAVQGYINRLTREGFKVAICEQVEDPKLCKDIVKRDVVRIITPGTNIDEETTSGENFIAAIYPQNKLIGFACLNLGTGYFQITELNGLEDFIGEFNRINPTECILPENLGKIFPELFSFLKKDSKLTLNQYETWVFEFEYASRIIKEQFKLASLEGLGLDKYCVGISAAGAIIYFLKDNLHTSLQHLKRPRCYSFSEFMLLDSKTQKNLEILEPISGDKSGVTLFKILNKTVTSLGSRLLRHWISKPLINSSQINERLDSVAEMVSHREELLQLREVMKDIRDLERILGRLSCGMGSARDLVALKQSLEKVPEIKKILSNLNASLLKEQQTKFPELDFLVDLINRAIVDCPPLNIKEGGMIRTGYSPELDKLYQISRHGKDFLGELQQREINRTGIKSLKVRYNRVFGYYIEITKANLSQVPDYYIRRQTLANAERFIIPELKEYEEKILNAEEKAFQLELEIFEEIRNQVLNHTPEIQVLAEAVATLD